MPRAMNGQLARCLVLLVFLSTMARGQNVSSEQLQVEAHIADERYCSVGSRGASLLIKFVARIRNGSDSTIELQLPTYPVARVSGNLDDAKNHKYEAVLHVPFIEYDKGASPEASSSKVIGPRETFAFKTMEVTFPLSLRENNSRVGELGFGTHIVELDFAVLDSRTKHFVKAKSQPIQVEVKKQTGVKPCS